METFTEARPLVDSRRYIQDRQRAVKQFDPRSLDAPILELVSGLNTLPCCFTLQSCFGHFICRPGQDEHTLDRVPLEDCDVVRYRIAYVAFCLENSLGGRAMYASLGQMAAGEPGYVQFGSADWFWRQHLNTYAIQVEPDRYKHLDEVVLDHAEALVVQQRRDSLFRDLSGLLERQREMHGAGWNRGTHTLFRKKQRFLLFRRNRGSHYFARISDGNRGHIPYLKEHS